MPVYNAGIYMKKAVESILSQSLKEIELILVDDGSTDGSSEKCDEYAKNDNRVVVIHQKNGGICNARNAALKIAKGEYIAFSDHDDEYLPGLLENSYKKAIKTNADVVKFCKKVYVTLDGVLVKERSNKLPDVIWGREEIRDKYFQLFDDYKIDCVWDSLFKRDLFFKNNIFFDEFYKCGGEDYDLTARYLPVIDKLVMMSDIFYIHYVREGISTSSKFNEFKFKHTIYLNKRVFQGASELGINLNEIKDYCNFFLTEFYLNVATAVLCHPNCDFSFKKKKKMVESLWDEPIMKNGFGNSCVYAIWKISKKNGLAYFLCKYKLLTLYILMHTMRVKQSNSFWLNKILHAKL